MVKKNPFDTILVQDHPKLEHKWGKLPTVLIPKRQKYQTRRTNPKMGNLFR